MGPATTAAMAPVSMTRMFKIMRGKNDSLLVLRNLAIETIRSEQLAA